MPKLGIYRLTRIMEDEVVTMLKDLKPYVDRIRRIETLFKPRVRWR